MADEPPDRDDKRGTPKGAGTVPGGRGGMIGNPPFVPTEHQRLQVRALAQIFPPHAQRFIALKMGFSEDTLTRHFRDDLDLGRADMLAAVGSQLIKRALNGADESVKGDLDAQKFVMARLGGWTQRVEMSGPGGKPIQYENLSESEVDAQIRELESKYGGADRVH